MIPETWQGQEGWNVFRSLDDDAGGHYKKMRRLLLLLRVSMLINSSLHDLHSRHDDLSGSRYLKMLAILDAIIACCLRVQIRVAAIHDHTLS